MLSQLKAFYHRLIGARHGRPVSREARRALIELNMLQLNQDEAAAWLHVAARNSAACVPLQRFISSAVQCLQARPDLIRTHQETWHRLYCSARRLNQSFEGIKATYVQHLETLRANTLATS